MDLVAGVRRIIVPMDHVDKALHWPERHTHDHYKSSGISAPRPRFRVPLR
jgi:acyl CoA:acetate/3-ketoacid CoA transferase beta subunit